MLTLLDCGLVIEFGPKQHETVVKILGAFTRRQGKEAAQLMVDTSSKCQANDWDVEMFIKGIEQIIVEDAEQVSQSMDGWKDVNCFCSFIYTFFDSLYYLFVIRTLWNTLVITLPISAILPVVIVSSWTLPLSTHRYLLKLWRELPRLSFLIFRLCQQQCLSS